MRNGQRVCLRLNHDVLPTCWPASRTHQCTTQRDYYAQFAASRAAAAGLPDLATAAVAATSSSASEAGSKSAPAASSSSAPPQTELSGGEAKDC